MSHFPVILSAPSGGGKTSIAHKLLECRQDVGYSVSCTTRAPRPGEVDGKDYYFLTRSVFLEKRQAGEFAESAEVHDNLYGTLRSEVARVLESRRHVVMDIDVQGARQFSEAFPDSVKIFVLPPSIDVLLQRLRARQTESHLQMSARLTSAVRELRSVEEYAYVIVNEDLGLAVRRVSAIIDAEGVRCRRVDGRRATIATLIEQLEHEIVNRST